MKIVLAISDYLDAIYADGKYVTSESPIYVSEGIEGLRHRFGMPLNIESWEVKDVAHDWIESVKSYPDDIRDVIFI